MTHLKPKENQSAGFLCIPISPISINKCWHGRRFKTPAYKAWREEFLWKCPKIHVPGMVEISITFYLKNWKTTDTNNLVKATLDGLVEAGVISDDRLVMAEHYCKLPVPSQHEERIEVTILPFTFS